MREVAGRPGSWCSMLGCLPGSVMALELYGVGMLNVRGTGGWEQIGRELLLSDFLSLAAVFQ